MDKLNDGFEKILDVNVKFYILTGVYPTISQIVEITGYSRNDVLKNVYELITCGYLELINDDYEQIKTIKKMKRTIN